jgi:cytochrome P450
MGAHLAHLQIQLALDSLLTRFPTLELAVGADEVVFSDATFMRSVEGLPISW